ncbi:tetratricopeptide repeat protein [Aquimarina sp. AU119]|uniref:tetratricopeptide repeat protein n=1 Tax=Aquimarina sp. AU119 TaxID=2108528 RepID=UPI00135B460F|nr:tetratricopeptide repeat protein [Aquimarina sp. AU119]
MLRYIFFFFVLPVFQVAALYAQDNQKINSTELGDKTPQELVDLIKKATPDEREQYETALLNYPQQDLETVEQYLQVSLFFYFRDDFKKCNIYLDKGIGITKKRKEYELLSKFYTLKGHTGLREGDNQSALDAYYFALDIAKSAEDLEQQIVTNSGLIIVLTRMNQLDKALEISRQILKSIDKTSFKETETHARILTTVNEVYLGAEYYDSVLHYAEKGIVISKLVGFKEGVMDLYIKKGMVFYHTKQYDQAFEFLLKAEDIILNFDIENKFFPQTNINYFLASCHYEQKEYDKAIAYLDKTLDSIKETDLDKMPVIQSHLLIANCYGEKKDLEKALYWHNKYLELNEEYQKNKDKTVSKIYTAEAEKLENEIENLKGDQIADKQTKTYVLIILIIVSVAFVFVVFNYRKKQKKNTVLFQDLMQKIEVLELREQKEGEQKEEVKEIIIDDIKVDEVLKGLSKLEATEYFLRSDCSLGSIAKKTKTNTTYLSKIIKMYKGKNFNSYINELRIDYVLRRLKNDKKFRSFSIVSIAKEIGYKSDNSFTKHFKAKTGLNPSYYIKKIEHMEEQLQS